MRRWRFLALALLLSGCIQPGDYNLNVGVGVGPLGASPGPSTPAASPGPNTPAASPGSNTPAPSPGPNGPGTPAPVTGATPGAGPGRLDIAQESVASFQQVGVGSRLAQTFVALPFLVVSLEGALRTAGDRYEIVASTLGARPGTVFRRVTLPLVLPGLVSGTVLAFARALGEFGATITFAGSLQGVTRTLPLEIYLQRETDPDAAVALALVLVLVAVAVIGFARQGRSAP